MKNLTTAQAILIGLGMIALAIASIPYSPKIVTPAFSKTQVQKISICDARGFNCTRINNSGELLVTNDK